MSQDTLKIGILFSLTGSTAVTENGQYQAALLAIKQINNLGGVNGRPVVPVVEDITSDPIIAVEKAIKLIEEDEVDVLLGTYTSACRKALIPVLEKHRILLLYPTLYEGNEQNQWIFYCGPVPNQQLQFFVPWIIANLGRSFFLIGSDYIFPRETNKHMHKLLNMNGGSIVGESYVPLGSKAFEHVLQELERSQPEVIFSTLVGDSAVWFYQQIRRSGLDLPVCSPVTAETEIAAIGLEYAQHHYSSFPYFQTIQSPANQSFVSAYEQMYGTNVISAVMESTYNSLFLLQNALANVTRVNTDSIRNGLYHAEFEAPQGHVRFDERTQHLCQYARIGRVNERGDFEILLESTSPIAPVPFMFGTDPDWATTQSGSNSIFDHRLLGKEELRLRQDKWQEFLGFFNPLFSVYPYTFFLIDSDGMALFSLSQTPAAKVEAMIEPGTKWSLEAKGNNGFGLAATHKQLCLVKGQQHPYPLLQDFVTVGLPILDDAHCIGVVGIAVPVTEADSMQNDLPHLELLTRCFASFLIEKKKRMLFQHLLTKDNRTATEGVIILSNGKLVFANEIANYLVQSTSQEMNRIITDLSGMTSDPVGKLIRREVGKDLFEIHLNYYEDYHLVYIRPITTDADPVHLNRKHFTFQSIVGRDEKFEYTLQIARLAAQTEANVLLIGESGTGKELYANAIHNESKRRHKPFIAINCGAVPKDSVLTQVFGYVQRSLSGTKAEGQAGIFEIANGGTLFLDEINELPFEYQIALLRVIEEQTITRLGHHAPIPVDVRVIAATSKNLREEIAYNGNFRGDLYYRLNVFHIELVPLRDRKPDIPELASYVLDELNQRNQTNKQFSSTVMERFLQHNWPGNVRELRNTVERGYYLSHLDTVIKESHLELIPHSTFSKSPDSKSPNSPLPNTLNRVILESENLEKERIIKTLRENDLNISKVSRKLGWSRTTLYKKMEFYQIEIKR